MSRIRLLLEWLAIFACSCAIVWWAAGSGITNRYDLQFLDLASSRRAAPASDELVIAAIDDRSLAAIGHWPWDRRQVARLVDRLTDAGAKAVVLDILFIEPSTPEADTALADAMVRSGRVALAHGFTAPQDRMTGVDPMMPLAMLADHAMVVGQVALDPDPDGTIRRIPVVVHENGKRFEHLQLAVLRALLGHDPKGLADVTGQPRPPIMPYRPAGSYRSIPAASILAGEVPAGFLKGKVVLVGAAAAGMGDIHPVPNYAGSAMPGIEIQANLHEALENGEFIRQVDPQLALWLSFVPVLVLFIGFWRLRPAMCLVLATLLVLLLMLGTGLVAVRWGLWLAPGPAIIALLLAYPLWGWRRLTAVSDFLASEAVKLAPASNQPVAPSLGGFDNVAKQVSRLRYLVDEVAERREFLTSVIEAAPDAICVFGSEGRLVLTNARARAIFGDQQNGLTFNDLLLAVRGQLVAEGRELVLPDGSAYAVAHSGSGGISEGGSAGGGMRVVAFVDITDMRRAEEERRHMLEFLSHDMRSPQVAILGLAGEREGQAATEERFARIGRHARHTLKLADDFVHLSRIAEAPLDLEEVDLCMIAEEAIDRAWFAAKEKGIALARHLPEDPVFHRADGHVLSRALDNLIGNAIKYSPAGSEVAVTIVETNAAVRLLISDQGPGLPAGRREDPFRRFGSRDKTAGMGAGLGLAFVQAAIAKHGAAITCETGADGGTCFTIVFPKS